MLDKAQQRLQRLPAETQRRVTFVQADGENADAVLCHGVLGCLELPEPLINQLCRCAAVGGVVSIMFIDWFEFSGVELDLSDSKQVAAMPMVELEASRRDPYRQLSRPFHLVGRKG
jgi:hypothetical protein